MPFLSPNQLRQIQGCSVWERGGNAVPANILESEQHSGKYWPQVERKHWSIPANHVVLVRLTLDQFIFWPKLPQTRDLASKISKNFACFVQNVHYCLVILPVLLATADSLSGRGQPLPNLPPAQLHAVRGGASSPLLGPRSRKAFPHIKIYHYTPGQSTEGNKTKHNISRCNLHETVFTHTFVKRALHYRRQLPKEQMVVRLCRSSRTFRRSILFCKHTSLAIVWPQLYNHRIQFPILTVVSMQKSKKI